MSADRWWREAIEAAHRGNDDAIRAPGSACYEDVKIAIESIEEDLEALDPKIVTVPPTADEIVDAMQEAGLNLACQDYDADMKIANAIIRLCAKQWDVTLPEAGS